MVACWGSSRMAARLLTSHRMARCRCGTGGLLPAARLLWPTDFAVGRMGVHRHTHWIKFCRKHELSKVFGAL